MMPAFAVAALAALGLFLAPITQPQARDPIKVDIYKGDVATVNSYIFSSGVSLIVMDVQRLSLILDEQKSKQNQCVEDRHLARTIRGVVQAGE